ncbi:MAG: VacJ family lipoprotein, partial [Caulobacteraceae bacterium]|nr:VacJ family lipoprotein [Caulobacteraceae bacterium]
MRRTILPALLTIALLAPVAGWARTHGAAGGTPGDPWERTNRRIYAFNQRLDRALIVPMSRLTSGLTPGPLGKAIHNFVVNLHETVVILNDLLQARPGPAVRSAFRLVVNSTIGGLGAVDVAKALGDPAHKNGFGDTLGRWGATPGPYLVVPVLGPSTIRDLFGSAVDDATEPLITVDFPYRTEVDITVSIVGGLNERAEVGKELDALLAGAADPYATLRSSYLQAREAEIRGEKALPPLPDIEDGTPPSGAPQAFPPVTAAPESPAGAPPPAAA